MTRDLRISEVLEELYALREENQSLKIDNDFLQRQNAALKMRCSKYALEIHDLESEIADMKFTQKYLTAEEAGRKFAEELLSVNAEIAAEQHEEKVVSAMGSFLGDDY